MTVCTETIRFRTKRETDIVNITDMVEKKVRGSKISDGTVTVFVKGSTGAVSTIEYEPGLLRDMPIAMERCFPKNITYAHDETWHDGNGHSHVRATFMGPSLTVPIQDGNMILGTWQQLVFFELDNKDRDRTLILTVMGE